MRLEKDGTTWTPYYLKGGRWSVVALFISNLAHDL